jgi:heat shock protein HtpX
MFRRIGFFLLTNILVMVTISLTLNLLGVKGYMTANGIDYWQLMVFCLVWGMGGSFISLLMSRFMAKTMTGAQVIDPERAGEMRWLVDMVHNAARNARLPKMPEVAVYPGAEINAFATGPSKSRSMVAVSQGLLRSMNKREIEGVIGHEVAHIQNGDMVTMTLLQGVVNAFGMFLARVIAFFVSQALAGNSDDEDRGAASPMVTMLITFVLDIVFTILGSMVVAAFSRRREYRADAGSAKILGNKGGMIDALRALQRIPSMASVVDEQPAMAAMKISGKPGWMELFSTHPPLEQRIRALETGVMP